MSIESTKNVKRKDAIAFLRNKGIIVYDDDCTDRLADMMYEHRDTIFENYAVFSEEEEYMIDNDEYAEWSYCYD